MFRSLALCRVTSSSRYRTDPASGTSSPAMMRRRVVFPDPDGPRRATSDPDGASTVTSSRTTFGPNRLQTFRAVMLMPSYIIPLPPPRSADYHVRSLGHHHLE